MLAHIYRGILDILHSHYNELRKRLITHIRSFDDPDLDNLGIDVSVYSFWRMLLEMIFNTYIHISLGVGILLSFMLILVTWPIRAIFGIYFYAKHSKAKIMEEYYANVELEQQEQVNLSKYNLKEANKEDGNTTKRSK